MRRILWNADAGSLRPDRREGVADSTAWQRCLAGACVAAVLLVAPRSAWPVGGELELNVIDADTGAPIACRVHLKNNARKAQKPPKVPFWHDHFVLDGSIMLKLPTGSYVFEMERGAEYLPRTGHFTIYENAKDSKTIDLKRFVTMSQEGWWSGDLEIERAAKDIEPLVRAEDLHVAEVVGWGNGKGVPTKPAPVTQALNLCDFDRAYHLLAGLEQRKDGSALILNLPAPLSGETAAAASEKSASSSAESQAGDAVAEGGLTARLRQARREQAWIDVRRAASWDFPIWLALGLVDSIEIADSQLGRLASKPDEAGCRPRDTLLFPGIAGIGRWPESIYFHVLECGLHIPPSAASGSGLANNPPGYNRMYVHLGETFSYEKWFQGLRDGRVMVTNGPLIRPNVDGQLPGYVFQLQSGDKLSMQVGLTLSTRDKISYLEVIKNGRTAYEVRLDELAKLNGQMPPVEFSESGWFLIRAVTDVGETHRFAATAPYYVESNYQRRISRKSVQFFIDWLDARAKHFPAAKQSAEMNAWEQQARKYWNDLLAKATVD